MRTRRSAAPSQRSDSPSPSLPIASASRGCAAALTSRRSTASSAGVSASSSRPASRSRSGPSNHGIRVHGTANTAPIEVRTARRYSGSARARRQHDGVDAERGGAAEHGPEVRVVAQVLQHRDPRGAGEDLLERRQRPPVHRRERAPVHGEAGRGRQHVVLDDEDVGARLLEEVLERRQPSLGEQDGAHLVAGGDGAADRSLALRDEQPLDLLDPRSQFDVAERHEVTKAWILRGRRCARSGSHGEPLTARRRELRAGELPDVASGSTAQECLHTRQTSSRTGVPSATRPCRVSLPGPTARAALRVALAHASPIDAPARRVNSAGPKMMPTV